jgi:hypothetical protein
MTEDETDTLPPLSGDTLPPDAEDRMTISISELHGKVDAFFRIAKELKGKVHKLHNELVLHHEEHRVIKKTMGDHELRLQVLEAKADSDG